MNKSIAVLSDTHGLLRPQVMDIVKNCDAVIHAGAIGKQEILDTLSLCGPIYAVRGNNDREWAAHLKMVQEFRLFGLEFYVVHKKIHLPDYLPGKEIVVYGHSHKYEEERKEGKLYLNPGSCGPRRFQLPVTMAVLTVTDGNYQIEKVEIE